jgi:ribosomal protein S8
MKEEILKILQDEGFVYMESQNDKMLNIYHRKFYGTEKEFLFELNAKAVYSCKTKTSALKKIQEYIDRGFAIATEV